jgi:predicted phage terminase large subunit-like protein
MVVHNTRYHYGDLYGHIIENMGNEFQTFIASVFDDEGNPIWPERFDKEKIERIKNRMESDPKGGRAFFVAQYMNKVIDEETASFKMKDIHFFAKDDEVPKELGVTITCDPAISEKESADRTAFVVRGVDAKRRWWILEVVAIRGLTPTDTINKLFDLYIRYSKRFFVGGVGVESISYQKSLIFQIRDKMMADGVFLPLVELGAWTTKKEYRIKGLIPLFENGMIYLKKPDESDQTEILLDELLRFPKGIHDDCADALAMHLEIDIESAPGPQEPEVVSLRDRYGYPIRQTSHQGAGVALL